MKRFWTLLVLCLPLTAGNRSANLPLSFEPNQGQTDPKVRFLARVSGYTLFVTSGEAVFAGRDGSVERMKLIGASAYMRAEPLDRQPGISNYFLGNDPTKWRTNIPNYGRFALREVYPGIDLIFYGTGSGRTRQLEYDWVIAPGADPKRIRVRWESDSEISQTSGGDLILSTSLRQKKPVISQDGKLVQGRYVVREREVRFEVAKYDATKPLVIDPVFVYSTYLSGGGNSYGSAIAVDGTGSAYVTGSTSALDFPTTNPLQATLGGADDAFVTKINAAGSALVYSTYLGGSRGDVGYGIAVDGSGSAYITGITISTDFPTVNPLQASTGTPNGNAFVTKLNPAGSALVYSTYLGGGGNGTMGDFGSAIAVDGLGAVYLTGRTTSTNFPLAGPLQGNLGGQFGNAFVTKLNAAGSGLVYSTYLGGSGNAFAGDTGESIAIDSVGNIYVTGSTSSANFPTANPLQASLANPFGEAFVTKIAATGALAYSTYLGGSGGASGYGIAVDGDGNMYVTGSAEANFPTAVPIQPSIGGTQDAFVAKISAAGSSLLYSTYLGGSGSDAGNSIAVDSAGNAYVTGVTSSINFPNANPIQASFSSLQDGFVAEIDPTGSALVYSTYLGGNEPDVGYAIAVDGSGNAYVTGATFSADFPTSTPLEAQNLGGTQGSGFVSVIPPGGAAAPVVSTLAHVADGNGFDTLVLLINTSTTDAQYSLQFFNQSGTQVNYQLDPTQSGMTGTIHPGSQAIVRTTGAGASTNVGWGQLTAPAAVKGMVIYQQQNSPISLQEGSTPIIAPSQHFFVPFDNANGATTSIGFANPSATANANLNLTVRYESGGTDTVPVFTMNPLQQIAEPLSSIWAGTTGQRGMIEVNADTPVGTVAFRFQGTAFTLFDAIAPTAGGSTPVTATLAHAADGNNFRSSFILTNSGTVPAPYTLALYGVSGLTQTFGFALANPLSGTVPAGSTVTIDTTGLGTVTKLGWAQLTAPPAVSGITVFRQTNPGLQEQQATLPISPANLAHFFLPFDNTGNVTSIALANPDAITTATVNVTLRYVDGMSSIGQLTIHPRNYGAALLTGLFPATRGKAGVAEFISNVPIAVVEVRFNPTQAFTSLRAVSP